MLEKAVRTPEEFHWILALNIINWFMKLMLVETCGTCLFEAG